mmetsp:Transcript_115488/g.333582  ORF Transcript_115488/g.333582 Transcript_115488/m.333582 type:complete len:658 (+) Transcript_115488:179-2152(+)
MSDCREENEEEKPVQKHGKRSGRVARNKRRQHLQHMYSGLDLFNALMMPAAPSRRRRGRGDKAARSQWSASFAAGSGPLDLMDRDLSARLAEVEPTDEDKQCIRECIKELEAALPSLGPSGWEIATFGSVASGFVVRDSDVDVTCLRASSERPATDGSEDSNCDDTEEPERILRERWQPLLADNPRFTVTEEVLFAKVPILKMRFDRRLDIDMSCENTMALQNTKLLKAYADMHPRVRELGIAIKLWAKGAQVCGASRRHLSSYTFTLMTIYFLQVWEDVMIPFLPTSCFEPGGEGEDDPQVQAARKSWTCHLSTAELVVNFFVFYNLFFQWGHEVVSLRLGSRHFTQEPVFEKLRGRWTRRLHIEDPYLLDRNLHCVLGDEEEVKLRCAFAEAFQALQFGQSPVGLRSLAAQNANWIELAANAEPASAAKSGTQGEEGKTGNDRSHSKPQGRAVGIDNLIEELLDEEEDEDDEEEEETSTAESRGAGGASSDEHGEASADHPPAQNWQWWRHLGSASVAEALGGRSDVRGGGLPAAIVAAAMAAPAPTARPELGRQRVARAGAGATEVPPMPQPWLSVRVLEAAIAQRSTGEGKCITVQDLEGNLGGPIQPQAPPTRTGNADTAGSKAFVSRSTGGIAARVNRLCRAGSGPAVTVA